MGLDSYLTGEKFFWSNFSNPAKDRTEDGLRIKIINVELGYWRKHPNLHGFIVQAFADGKDECQRIELDRDDINKIIAAIEEDSLPHTEGFFFGVSDDSEERRKEDVEIFKRALKWLREGDDSPVHTSVPTSIGGGMMMMEVKPTKNSENDTSQRVSRTVIYQASW